MRSWWCFVTYVLLLTGMRTSWLWLMLLVYALAE